MLQDASFDHDSAAAGGNLSLEQHTERILKPDGHLGWLELLAFMLSVAANNGQELCIQVWTPGQSKPRILFKPSATDSGKAPGSRRRFAYNVLAASLSRSGQVVWLPLVKTGYRDDHKQWERRLKELDGQTAVDAAAEAPVPSRAVPASAKRAGLRASLRLQRPSLQRRVPRNSVGHCTPQKRGRQAEREGAGGSHKKY